MNNKVLFAGNGINTINNSYSWQDLIVNLTKFIGAENRISIDNKPFPLLYEQIITKSLKKNITELEVKKFISREVTKLESNNIHKRIIESGIKNILTTNYDYTLESIQEKENKTEDLGVIKQTVYSLFRHNMKNDINIWHIHGEANVPTSIMLGYEQYSGYMQKMREYIISGKVYKSYETQPVKTKIETRSFNYDSWLDYFFTHDIYIFGLTLDFVEMHLWWLLTYRARRIQQGKFQLKNKIFYYYPNKYGNAIKHKLDLLENCQVETFSIDFNDKWEDYYNTVIDRILDN